MAETEHRAFSTFIGDLEEGRLHAELTSQIRDIVAELHNVLIDQGGKPKAALAIKLNFKLDSGVIEVDAETKATLPKRLRSKSIFYATPSNDLTRRNPKQTELPLRDVSRAEPARAV